MNGGRKASCPAKTCLHSYTQHEYFSDFQIILLTQIAYRKKIFWPFLQKWRYLQRFILLEPYHFSWSDIIRSIFNLNKPYLMRWLGLQSRRRQFKFCEVTVCHIMSPWRLCEQSAARFEKRGPVSRLSQFAYEGANFSAIYAILL